MTHDEIDVLCAQVDDLMCAGDFETLNKLLAVSDETDIERCVAVLTFTIPAREHLPSRSDLIKRFEPHLVAADGTAEAELTLKILRGS